MKTIEANEMASESTVVALGVFDGVHLGHQELFHEASSIRQGSGLPVMAMTFHPHPRTLTGSPNGYDCLLTPPGEKAALLADCGSDYFSSLPFTRELAATPPREFVRTYLVEKCRAAHVVCGFNFTFGHKGAGNPRDLSLWGREMGFAVRVVPPFVAGADTVSSTRVRSALASGDVQEAALCLGRPYCLTGRVAPGDGRGRRIGIPTSNLSVQEDKIVPGNGVYAALVRVMVEGVDDGAKERLAVVNVGTRPTFSGEGVRVEAHIPGFSGDLYGRGMQVLFIERLRDERKFDGADSLRAQVEEDVRRALAASQKACSFTLPGAYDRMLALELP